MYERCGMQALPYPWYALPGAQEPLTTLDFLPAMSTLLENIQGLAATCHAASVSDDVAQQEVRQALFVLKEYLEAAVVLFARWKRDVHGESTVNEEA